MSGYPTVFKSFVSPRSDSLVSQSGLWCPALRLPSIHLLFPYIAIHLSPSPAGSLRLSVFRLPSPGGLCLATSKYVLPLVLPPSVLSPSCLPGGFPDVISQLPPRFLHMLSSCLQLVSRMWPPHGHLLAFLTSHLSPRIGHRIVSKCPPFVTPCHPVVSQLSFRCCFLLVT